MKKLLTVVVVVLVIGGAGYYWQADKAAPVQTLDIIPGETVTIQGAVTFINKDQAAYDGPYLIEIETSDNFPVVVAIPSMGLSQCAAYKNKMIGDISLVEIGQKFEVRGLVGNDGAIVPCESADHFFRQTR
jgi:hypothetical protein